MIVHACHCRWCQRETGTVHALNAVYEAERVVHTGAEPEIIDTPSASGKGQKIARCPKCKVAIWSNYSQSGALSRFVRVGTLDEPDRLPPDIHIYTSSKQPWVVLPSGAKAVSAFYNPAEVWSPESRERWRAMLAKAREA
jgi:hypothetical protein